MSNVQLATDIQANFLQKYRINENLLGSSKFIFITHNMPFLNYFCQSIQLPSVSTSPAIQPTPLVNIPRAGDKMIYEPFTVTALIDEDLRMWEETHNWIRGLTFPEKDSEYSRQKKMGIYHDMHLLFLKNSNTDNLKMKFIKCFPSSISSVRMSSTDAADVMLTADITFYYDIFNFERN